MTQTPLRRTPSLLRGIGALVVLLGVVIGVPVLLTTLMQILDMTPHGLPSIHDIATTLNKRDNGQLVAGVLLIAAWICWALFTLSLLPEIAAAVRHRPAVHLRGLSGFQRPAGALVAAVAIGFTLAPLVSATAARAATTPPPLPKASATATSATLAPSTIVGQPATSSATAAPAIAPTSHAPTANSSAPTYLVQRRDTLWGIAERYLQNPLRYGEIAALNPGVVGPDNEIHPGAVLTLPADATGLPSTDTSAGSAHMDVVVQPGDTLSGIVTDVAGDRAGWEQAWQANAGRAEPDGATFTDPDLIKPGWTLSIPTSQTDPANGTGKAGPTPTNPGPPTRPAPPPRSVPTTPISPTSTPGPSTTAPAPPTTPAPVGDASDHSGTHSSEVRVLAFAGGGGLLLAGVSLTALMRYRRRQFRRRRPGRTIGGSPESLIHLERAVLATGRAGAADVTWLDQALRSLVQASAAESAGRLPDVVAVCVAAEELTLVLAGPAPAAPAPWCVDATGCRWSIHRADQLPYDPARRSYHFAPYPMLASVGYTVSGEHWLLDLERIASLSLTGDAQRCLNLARFLAAELAHNTWSEMLQVTLVGFGRELIDANPDRLVYTEDLDGAVRSLGHQLGSVTEAMRRAEVDVLAGRLHDIVGDAWAPNVLLIAPHLAADREGLDRLLATMKLQHSRTSVALVLADADDPDRADVTRWQLRVDSAGVLSIPALGVDLIAEQIPAEEAAQLARMLALAAVTEDEPIPAAHGDQPWDEYADACGGLTVQSVATEATWADRVAARDVPVVHLADSPPWRASSVLPLSPQTYMDKAATTMDDLRALAPIVDEEIRTQVELADSGLDADLVQWADAQCLRPKLTLLGRVVVRAQGSLPDRSPQEPFHTEVVAYLATAVDGVPSAVYAQMMWPHDPDVIGKTKVRQSITTARKWLGRDPVTGEDYLPSWLHEPGAAHYRIKGGLIDAELFRRLRLRGLSRGPDGLADLWRALDLVQGRPFADIPAPRDGAPGGYVWMTEANRRLDHEYSVMIVDTAHTLAIHHFASGEPELAAKAAQVSLLAGSYEDTPLLDLVRACLAQEKEAEAEAYVQQILSNNNVDDEEELPPRTAEVLFRLRRQWVERAS